jgi:hypothetical protein
MRTLNVTDTAIDLAAETAPFLPGYTFSFVNASAATEIVQESDAVGSGYTTAVELEAGESADVVITKRYIKLASAGLVQAIGN